MQRRQIRQGGKRGLFAVLWGLSVGAGAFVATNVRYCGLEKRGSNVFRGLAMLADNIKCAGNSLLNELLLAKLDKSAAISIRQKLKNCPLKWKQ